MNVLFTHNSPHFMWRYDRHIACKVSAPNNFSYQLIIRVIFLLLCSNLAQAQVVNGRTCGEIYCDNGVQYTWHCESGTAWGVQTGNNSSCQTGGCTSAGGRACGEIYCDNGVQYTWTCASDCSSGWGVQTGNNSSCQSFCVAGTWDGSSYICNGTSKYRRVCDGSGGYTQGALLEANSTDCGYIPTTCPQGGSYTIARCPAESVTLDATTAGATGYSWTNGGTGPTTTWNSMGGVNCNITFGNGCQSITKLFTFSQKTDCPNNCVTGTTTELTICAGQSIQLSSPISGAGFMYGWNGNEPSAGQGSTFTATGPGTYSVLVWYSTDCPDAYYQWNVRACTTSCTLSANASSVNVCPGETVNLSYSVNGTPPSGSIFTWSGSGVNGSSVTIPSTAAGQQLAYTVSGGGCTQGTVTVNVRSNCTTPCTNPSLATNAPVCSANGQTYSVNVTTNGTITSTAGTVNGSTISNIPVGTNITITASLNGCITTTNVTSPNCSAPCTNPSLTPGSPVCSANGQTYSVNVTTNGTITSTAGIVNGSTISNIPVGTNITLTASLNGCTSTATVTSPNCTVPVFDLALKKTLASGQSSTVVAGSNVTFTVTVYNQGNVDATNVQLSDYIPAGLTLNDANWTANAGKASLNTPIATLAAGASTTRNIVFTVGSGVTGVLTNTAEISSATGGTDVDSTPDNDPTNDGTAQNDVTTGNHKTNPNDDEDDADPEPITVTPACTPPTPTGTAASRCGIGTVTLTATGCDATYPAIWFSDAALTAQVGTGNSFTTPAITATTTYYVACVKDAACKSAALSVVATINPAPTLTVSNVVCAANLLTYSLSFASTGTITSTAGTVSGNTITGITAGTSITLTATLNGCTTVLPVTAPNCACPTVNPPTGSSASICAGTTLPALTVTVGAGLQANWYSAATGGTLLQANSLSYTPTAAGTFYVEAINAATNCKSATRTPIVLTIKPSPGLTPGSPVCSANGQTYSVSVTTNGTLTSTAGTVNGNTISNIPVGTNITLTASLNGCTSTATVTSPNCTVPVFDLALVKKLATGQAGTVTPGSSVTFTITVYNQGNVNATNVQLSDYIPAGLTLNDANWTANAGKASLNTPIASLAAGQSVTRNIVFTVGSGVTGVLTNTAEISSATGGTDVDSTPDNDPTNDGTAQNDVTTGNHKTNPNDDEDDSDPEPITVTPYCAISLTTNSLPVGTVGQAYSANLTVSGGTAPYSFLLAGGTLPTGLTLSSTGLISGIPTATGTFSTTIRITDSQSCSVTVPLAVLNIQLAPTCSLTVTATPGSCQSATNTYSVSGILSLTNNTNGGTILLSDGTQLISLSVASGVSSVPYSLTGLISDGLVHTLTATLSGCGTASVSYTAPQSCTAACQPPIHVCKGSGYGFEISATSGLGTYQWYRNGSAISGATGSSFTATQAGSYSVVVNGNVVGQCPDGSCCPVVIVEDEVPLYQANVQTATCR
ncbi:Ig-like domain-containing protein, partial [Spirosoma migulaei]